MYLKKLRLKNIKCFEDVTLEFPHTDGDYSGWNVILGENGVGKTAILKAMAFGIINLFRIQPYRIDERWIRLNQSHGVLTADVQAYQQDSLDHPFGPTPTHSGHSGHPGIIDQSVEVNSTLSWRDGGPPTSQSRMPTKGWHATGYGPFRRLAKTAGTWQRQYEDRRFASLFDDAETVTEFSDWLPSIYTRSIDTKLDPHEVRNAQRWLELVISIVNSVLPEGIEIHDVTSQGVQFRTATGVVQGVSDLSDGYRAFLAIVADLLRFFSLYARDFFAMVESEFESARIMVEGIVLIDEADAHLHPSWQRELGERLCKVFPKIQFIVTTHSPFIAQEATDGGLFVLRPTKKGTVEVETFEESVRGWTATQILTSSLFGLDSTRSIDTEALIRESAELTAKEQGQKLTAKEKRRFAEVKQILNRTLSAPGETYEEMTRQQDMADYVDETLKRLKNGKP